jgi:predicted transcriptional regulator
VKPGGLGKVVKDHSKTVGLFYFWGGKKVKNKRLVSIPKFAKLFGLTAPTVRAHIKRDDWPIYNFGDRTIRLDVDEIAAFVRKGKRPKASEESRGRGVMDLLADESGSVTGLRGTAKKSKE